MTCCTCASGDEIKEKARVSALEKQNTDLIEITRQLLQGRLQFNVAVAPDILAASADQKLRLEHLAKHSARRAVALIENMLEDRRQFFRDYDLLKMYASKEYFHRVNADMAENYKR